jgi:hypothetical protein
MAETAPRSWPPHLRLQTYLWTLFVGLCEKQTAHSHMQRYYCTVVGVASTMPEMLDKTIHEQHHCNKWCPYGTALELYHMKHDVFHVNIHASCIIYF